MKAPDIHSPRFYHKYKNILSKEFYTRFREKYPQYSHYDDKAIHKAVAAINKTVAKEVISNRDGIQFSEGLGFLFIGTYTPKKLKMKCWKKSVQLGVDVYHRNPETDGNMAKIKYNNYGCKYTFELRQLWYFTGSRNLKRTVAKEYPKQWQKYIKIDSYKGMWDLFNKRDFRDKSRSRHKEELKTYSEFDLE